MTRRRRWVRPALVGVVVVAVAAAAAFANVALLGAVGEDRIGKLRPVDPTLATLGTAPVAATTTAPATTTTAPVTTKADDDHHDDGDGHGWDWPDWDDD